MNLITREELRRRLQRGDELQLVMALPVHAYRVKRIPGTRHFETIGEALDALDPEDEIVLYCATVYCPASIYAYALLEREGYRHVSRYAGGIDDWEAAGYPLETGEPDEAPPRARRDTASRASRISRHRWPAARAA
jgi:rhodanese-related sulfurtransferase